MPLKDASRELAINYSTAKTILRIFRIEKRIEKKNADEERALKQLIQDFKNDKRGNFAVLPEIQQENYLNNLTREISTTTNSPEVAPRSLNEKSNESARLSLITNLTRKIGDTKFKKFSNCINYPMKMSSTRNDLNVINNCNDLSFLEMKLKNLNNNQERASVFHQILSIYQNDINSFSNQIFNNQILLTRLMQVASNMQHINPDLHFNPMGKNLNIFIQNKNIHINF